MVIAVHVHSRVPGGLDNEVVDGSNERRMGVKDEMRRHWGGFEVVVEVFRVVSGNLGRQGW